MDHFATKGCATDVLQPEHLSWTYSIKKVYLKLKVLWIYQEDILLTSILMVLRLRPYFPLSGLDIWETMTFDWMEIKSCANDNAQKDRDNILSSAVKHDV